MMTIAATNTARQGPLSSGRSDSWRAAARGGDWSPPSGTRARTLERPDLPGSATATYFWVAPGPPTRPAPAAGGDTDW